MAHDLPRLLQNRRPQREARLKVSPAFSKAAGCRGGAPARAPQSAESSCAHKSAGGGPRGNPRRGFPLLFFAWCVCAVTLGVGRWPALPFDPISLVLAQRNGVEPPKKSAFLPRRLHHSRERYCLGGRGSSSPDLGRGWCWSGAWCGCAVTLGVGRWPSLQFDPISLVLAQRNGVEPPKKSAFLPWRLHHSRERYCLGYLYSSSPDLGRGWCWSGALYVCADTLGGGDGLPCLSTPFLWCLPKETVSSRQRKALFLPRRLHHSRERSCLGGRGSSSPDLGRGWWSSERLPSPGANGICYGRFARSVYCTGVTVVIRFRPPPKARFFGAPPRFFAQEQRNGVELAVGGGSF